MFNSFKCYALFVLTAGDVEDLNSYINGDCMRVQFLIKNEHIIIVLLIV